MRDLKVYSRLEAFGAGVGLIFYTDTEGHRQVARPIVLEPFKVDAVLDSTLSLSNKGAQQLMDELWQCGFRPSEGSGSAGALAATQRHLEDMRKLVFDRKGGVA